MPISKVWSCLALCAVSSVLSFRVIKQSDGGDSSAFPALCDADIVEETCADLSGHLATTVSMADVGQTLSASQSEMLALWALAGLDAPEVSCKQLCDVVAKTLEAEGIAPPASYLGCEYRRGSMECDMDLSRSATRKPSDVAEHDDPRTVHAEWRPAALSESEEPSLISMERSNVLKRDGRSLLKNVAQLFRIFPPLGDRIVDQDLGDRIVDQESDMVNMSSSMSEVRQRNQEGMEWITHAVQKINGDVGKRSLKTFFGSSSSSTRNTVRDTLNSAKNVMSRTTFVYPAWCDPGVTGYVYWKNTRCNKPSYENWECKFDGQGRPVTYICKNLMENQVWWFKVVTMVHEATHHVSTTDYSYQGQKYGYEWAKRYAAARPVSETTRNAESYMWFVSDMYDYA